MTNVSPTRNPCSPLSFTTTAFPHGSPSRIPPQTSQIEQNPVAQSICNLSLTKPRTMDPNTSTREEFTAGLTKIPLPPVPLAPDWKGLAEELRTLLDRLAHHPAMAPNLQQTYMTPAASKNNVYFMWDFVGRTLVSRMTPRIKALWKRNLVG